MSPSPDANELLDRSAALLQSQSTLIDTLLRRCKDLHNDAEILRGTVKATVAEREREANRMHRIALVEDRDAARHEVDYLKGLIRDGKLVYVEKGSK